MTPTSVQLWERIQATGLATQEECRNWAIEIAKSSAPECLNDASKLATVLIRLGKITSFQANVLFDDLPIPIAVGPYRITESLESSLGANWFLAFDSSRSKHPLRWCYLLTLQELQRTALQSWPPSLDLATKQVALSHPSIDKWLFSGIHNSSVVAFCEVLDGQSLTSVLSDRTLSWSESAAMVEQIATGLQKMHESGLVHGCVCPDAIWCGDDGEFVLRRDPFFPPVNPYATNGNSVFPSTREDQLAVAAPELTLPNSSHTFQTNLYALGCFWSRSLGPSKLPAPIKKCLDHLLAKNPAARFATASEFIKAIEFAMNKSEKQPNTPAKVPEPKRKKPSGPKKKTGKKKSKKKKPIWLLPAIVGGSCLIFALIITLLVRNGGLSSNKVSDKSLASTASRNVNRDIPKTDMTGQGSISNSDGKTIKKPTDSTTDFFAIEADDGRLLWAPPQAGSPHSLEMFPAGLEAMVFVSGNAWNHRGSLTGIGKWWNESQPDLTKLLTGFPLLSDDRINAVAIALYPSKKPGVPQAVFRISYSQPVAIDSVTQSVPGFSLRLFEPNSSKKKGLWSNKSPSNSIAIAMDGMQTDGSAMIDLAVVGAEELIATLPELNGGSAPLRRQLEILLKATDSRSDICVLFAPSFLFGDGRELLSSAPKAQETLRDSIDESMQAVAFTTTFEPRWYMELRMLGSETRDAGKFTASLKSNLLAVPEGFEKGLSSGVTLHPYWRALGLRYPQMMRTLNRYGRFGFEDGQVVANAYLPTDAMSNIVVASWMALNNSAGEPVPTVALTPKPATKPPAKSIEEVLESKITIGFEQESLESALQLIASEVSESVLGGSPISMAINGTAFQKEGITRNQQVRAFKQSGTTLRAVLTDLVRRANPVTTVQSPTERNQKVVWLVLEDPERPGENRIELTTRTWSEANKVSLPKEFVPE